MVAKLIKRHKNDIFPHFAIIFLVLK